MPLPTAGWSQCDYYPLFSWPLRALSEIKECHDDRKTWLFLQGLIAGNIVTNHLASAELGTHTPILAEFLAAPSQMALLGKPCPPSVVSLLKAIMSKARAAYKPASPSKVRSIPFVQGTVQRLIA